ncbi:hypothetical protein [Chitinophaga tropicalis]|uniref:Uncharacterized protein n=1 Tax=Chitinophaga tropicalis TaxID=2683588 RepID=A0A7K1U216_9BACT|nr:hypothetical protein [Chitinophaga tropicalis]MVT08397.1 hypothetical protein [Chitinophaga tropicalis]
MKVLICMLLGIFLIPPVVGYSQTQKNRLKRVIIEFEDFMTTTSEGVNCEYFRATFKNTLDTIEILNSKELNTLFISSRRFIRSNEKPIDVRAIVRFEFEHWQYEYCMNRFGIFVDKKTNAFYVNRLLSDFIRRKCLPPNML